MNGAQRKTKLSTYEVTLTLDIEAKTVVTVDARNAEEAEQVALNIADNRHRSLWTEEVVAACAKAKVKR